MCLVGDDYPLLVAQRMVFGREQFCGMADGGGVSGDGFSIADRRTMVFRDDGLLSGEKFQ